MDGDSLLSVISWLATVSTIGLFLSGSTLCREIRRRGDTVGITMVPFLVTAVHCAIWLQYGLLKRDSTLIWVNSAGFCLEVSYLAFYLIYSNPKLRPPLIQRLILSASAFFVVCFAATHSPLAPMMALGYVGCVTAVGVYAAPLATISQVLRFKNSAHLSFPLCIAGLVVSLEWCLYGFLVNDAFLIVPNVVGVGLGLSQMSLFATFPARPLEDAGLGTSLV